jgi:hypothetical protein
MANDKKKNKREQERKVVKEWLRQKKEEGWEPTWVKEQREKKGK